MDESQLILLAKVAEQAERFDDMADYMKQRVNLSPNLNAEERDMFSAAFKNSLSSRRHALRIASAVAGDEAAADRSLEYSLAEGYKSKLEAELESTCTIVTELLTSKLVPQSPSGEPRVFYLKMQGDYSRYLAEFTTGDLKARAVNTAAACYKDAMDEASRTLFHTHPVRLGLALNFSVFQHEVLGAPLAAIETASAAHAAACQEIVNLPPEAQEAAQCSVELLADNLKFWTSDS
mmetsp:Transcript_27381/g.43878  ORF Transcript_27381/g.43878 Transcript_27381/m.43878 type:complete len:235 (+) Transcript_27381:54-758(+)